MKHYFNTIRRQQERILFKGLPYHKNEKKAELQKRREQVALDRRHKEHCKSLYL